MLLSLEQTRLQDIPSTVNIASLWSGFGDAPEKCGGVVTRFEDV